MVSFVLNAETLPGPTSARSLLEFAVRSAAAQIDGLANVLAIIKIGNHDRHELHTGRNRIAALA
jgi:hypothetical protein